MHSGHWIVTDWAYYAHACLGARSQVENLNFEISGISS
jgi:hypothetical protein